MNLKEVIELIKTIDSTNIEYMKLEIDNLKLETSKKINLDDICTTQADIVLEKPNEDNIINLNNKQNNLDELDTNTVVAPIMGTFYSSPSPDSDPFVKIGAIVKSGETLCILEAMKLMNEIKSDIDGEVVDVLVNNEDLVEYNQPMFKIKPI